MTNDTNKIPGMPVCGDSDCNSCERWPEASSPAMNTASPTDAPKCKPAFLRETGNMGEPVERCANCGTYRGNPCRLERAAPVGQGSSDAEKMLAMRADYDRQQASKRGTLGGQGSAPSGEAARERFEAWAIGIGFDVSRDTYGEYHAQGVQQRWEAWAAALAASAEQANNTARADDLLNKLRAVVYAADAVIERWDSTKWKDEPHTAGLINRLRAASAQASSNCAAPVAERAAAPASVPEADAILAARAEGRAEALEILTGLDPESGIDEYTGWSAPVGPEDEGSAYWEVEKLRNLFSVDDKLHNLFDRAEAMYWEASGKSDDAERMMQMVKRAPYFQPLHDFLARHQAWDLMHDLQRASATTPDAAPEVAQPADSVGAHERKAP